MRPADQSAGENIFAKAEFWQRKGYVIQKKALGLQSPPKQRKKEQDSKDTLSKASTKKS
jgi:hypothetical protein